MLKRRLGTIALAGLAFGSMGATECEYFSEVTVPSYDSTRPSTVHGVWKNGVYERLSFDGAGWTHQLSSKSDTVYALSATYDNEGAKSVKMDWEARTTCCTGTTDLDCRYEYADGEIYDNQWGGVGSRVSNGIYVGRLVAAEQFENLCGSRRMRGFRFTWWTRSKNFWFGGLDSGTGRIEWHP